MNQKIELFMDNRRYTIEEKTASHSEPWNHTVPKISYSTMLPNVLLAPIEGNSISMVRSLKQIKELLEGITMHPVWSKEKCDELSDKINASLEDIELMLGAIK